MIMIIYYASAKAGTIEPSSLAPGCCLGRVIMVIMVIIITILTSNQFYINPI